MRKKNDLGICKRRKVILAQAMKPYRESRSVKKLSLYRSGVAQRVGRSIALLFHDRGT